MLEMQRPRINGIRDIQTPPPNRASLLLRGMIVLMRSMCSMLFDVFDGFDVVRCGSMCSMCSMWFEVFDEFHEFDVVR